MSWVAFVGEDFSRHDNWGAALDHVAAQRDVSREDLWFRDGFDCVYLFDGPFRLLADAIARVFCPVQYQRAKSRGDLEQVEEFRRAGDPPPTRQAPTTTTMNEAPKIDKAKPAKLTYIVTEKAPDGRLIHRAKVVRTGGLLDEMPKEATKNPFARWLKNGWVQLATDEEIAAPPTPAPEAKVDRASVSLGMATAPADGAAVQVQQVAIAKIKPDPTQPRKNFADEEMAKLVASVKKLGVELAILVRPMSRWRQVVSFMAREFARREAMKKDAPKDGLYVTDFWAAGIQLSQDDLMTPEGIVARLEAEGRATRTNGGIFPTVGALAAPTGDRSMPGESEWLEIVYGERRWRAAQEAGLTVIPAKVRELTDIEAAEKQAVENLDRADLAPLEVAAQYRKLLDLPGYGMARLIETTGYAKNTILGKLKLLDLPEPGRAAVANKSLNVVTAERIGRLKPRVQEVALAWILNPQPHLVENGSKLPSDRICQQLIKQAEEAVAREERWESACAEAVAKGIKPLEGKELEAEITYNDNGAAKHGSKYVAATNPCYEHPQNWTWGKILGKAAKDLTVFLGRDTKGNGHVWMLRTDAEAKAKELGIKLSSRSGGGGGSSGSSASEKARAAAERKRRQQDRQLEDAGLAEIVATVEATDPARLSLAFWRHLAVTMAKETTHDTLQRLNVRRGNSGKGRSNDLLAAQAENMSQREAFALVVETLTLGIRGSYGVAKNVARMRDLLGLSSSASARTQAEP